MTSPRDTVPDHGVECPDRDRGTIMARMATAIQYGAACDAVRAIARDAGYGPCDARLLHVGAMMLYRDRVGQ